ncbi:VWA domain-containing protein [Reinekea blandensis]|uniref:VWFA domain-containing protein n=1 Tax=Reinekea blandensis MED297 TaxID=314283 RepID=A4BEC4_9GAMM|nr:VWA domain-containing protein [Reinekea blandensis]EAR09602.1 hypothetical protein MED297_12762 [Reinekea blandensis MED297]
MNIAWPWFLLLIPVVVLVSRLRRHSVDSDQAIDHPMLFELAQQMSGSSSRRMDWRQVLTGLLLIAALIRPQWIGDPLNLDQRGRSLYLAVDLSESMLEQDMIWNQRPVSRYEAMQAVISEFVEDRRGDFIGLVVFGSFADVQAPLTPDLNAIQSLLADLRPGMADSRTAIGDGLALAVRQLRESTTEDRVVVLLSDGENNSGEIRPDEATAVAAAENIRVYTIGFGSAGRDSLLQSFGLRSSSLDEQTLREIAEQTQGRYYRATSSAELAEVFRDIERLEPSDQKTDLQRQTTELYWLPLLGIAVLYLVTLVSHLRTGRSSR